MKSRRSFLKSLGNVFALASMPFSVTLAGNYRFNIVGGGVAGTRVAAYLKMSLPSATVTLFDPSLKGFSESVYSAIQNNYKPVSKDVLDAIGVDTITEKAVVLEPEEKTVILANGKKHKADFLIIAPGIDFKWHDIKGYKPGVEQLITHAWQHPGTEYALWQQIKTMNDGDNVIISVPVAPYRFPQGPYQRATRIADYLKISKPASKVIILDGNDEFPSMSYYLEHWKRQYPGNTVEWVSASSGGYINKVNIQKNILYVEGETIKAGVLNLIPAQQSGYIARQAGLNVNSDWCQVNSYTLESIHHKHVYVIGDANDADLFNKTAVVADQQALQCVSKIKSIIG